MIILSFDAEKEHTRNIDALLKIFGSRIEEKVIIDTYDRVRGDYADAKILTHVPFYVFRKTKKLLAESTEK